VDCSVPVKLLPAIVRLPPLPLSCRPPTPSAPSPRNFRGYESPPVPKCAETRGEEPVMGPRWVYICLMPAAIRNKLLGGAGN